MDRLIRIAESVAGKSFEKWFDDMVMTEFDNVNRKIAEYGMPFDMTIEYDDSYESEEDFDEHECSDGLAGDMVAVALLEDRADAHVIPVAVNKPMFEDIWYDDDVPTDRIENEFVVTLWHEVAHGILDNLGDLAMEHGVDMEFSCDDEEACEEFGKAKGNLEGSRLGRWIMEQKRNGWSDFVEEDEEDEEE